MGVPEAIEEGGLYSKRGMESYPPMQALYPPVPHDGIGGPHFVERDGVIEQWTFAANALSWRTASGTKVYPAPAYAAGWRYRAPAP